MLPCNYKATLTIHVQPTSMATTSAVLHSTAIVVNLDMCDWLSQRLLCSHPKIQYPQTDTV